MKYTKTEIVELEAIKMSKDFKMEVEGEETLEGKAGMYLVIEDGVPIDVIEDIEGFEEQYVKLEANKDVWETSPFATVFEHLKADPFFSMKLLRMQ